MNDEIKSAREIAMEKLAAIGEASEEERLSWKYLPEGEKLAARYVNGKAELARELAKYDDKARALVKKGAAAILVRNIVLPKDDAARKTGKRAMDGLKELKDDRVTLENIFSQLRRIFTHYAEQGEQQKNQAYEALKADYSAKIQEAVRQQLGTTGNVKIDVEKQPQFQQEWLKMKNQMESQYHTVLDEAKQALAAID